MPIIRPDTVKTEQIDDTDNPCGPVTAQLFSDSGALTQFGAFVEILPPGSRSSVKHWHQNEDEMVYLLAGEVLLHEGDTTTNLRAGEAATFKAGVPVGHCLENVSEKDARYLVIGTRSAADTVTYPDHDRVLKFTRNPESRSWFDQAGNKTSSPYAT